MTATRERIERIAQQQVEPYGASSLGELVRGHVISALTALCEEMEREKAIPKDDWVEEDGDVLWWSFPIVEPPYVGMPIDTNFPDDVTHWTRLTVPQPPAT